MANEQHSQRERLLKLLLPDEGPYTYAVRRGGKLDNRRDVLTVDALLSALSTSAEVGASFCLACFAGGHERKHVVRARSWVLDADYYEDAQAAVVALRDFGTRHGIPLSLVFSGTKAHGYIAVEAELDGEKHRQIGQGLLGLASASGLKLDSQPTASPEMLMRAPGTLNEKSGNHALVLAVAERMALGELVGKVAQYLTKPRQARSAPVQADLDATADALVGACRQAARAADQVGPVGRAVRHLLFKTLAWTAGGSELAHQVCAASRPGYDRAKVDKIVSEGEALSGPVKCETWESANPGGCDGCPHKGRIATPVAAAGDLPPGFVRRGGLIYAMVGEDNELVRAWDEPLRYVQHGVDGLGKYRVVLRRKTPNDGWRDVVVPTALFGGRSTDLLTCLSSQGMVVANGEEGKALDRLVKQWFRKGQMDRPSEVFSDQFGWRDDGAFVLGREAYTKDGRVARAQLGTGGAEVKARHFVVGGTMDGYLSAVRCLRGVKAHHALFTMLMSLSAPLWKHYDFSGVSVCLNHRHSGSGKTLALELAAAVWGDPKRQMVQVSTSELSKAKNLAILNNLPMFMDEITPIRAGELNSFVMQVSEGTDKDRMVSSGDLRETHEWDTVLLMSSNTSAAALLQRGRQTSHAQALRVIDLAVPRKEGIEEWGKAVGRAIADNYGHLGVLWVKQLVALGKDGIVARLREADAELDSMLGAVTFQAEERFWRAALVLALAAGRMTQAETGVDPEPVVRWAAEQVILMRSTALELEPDAVDLVAEFIREHQRNTVRMCRSVKTKEAPWFLVDERTQMDPVYARLELLYNGNPSSDRSLLKQDAVSGVAFLSRQKLQTWLAERGTSCANITPDLNKAQVLLREYDRTGELVALGRGVPHASTTKSRVLAVQLDDDPRLSGLLRTGVSGEG